MYVASGLGAYQRKRRGLGAPLGYDEEGLPIENPADTTYGSQSGGTYPLNPTTNSSLPSTTWQQWINLNPVPVMIGAGAILVVALFAKAGR